MAQCVMQNMVNEAGLSDSFTIDSAATTNEEIGNPLYPPAHRKLQAEGVPEDRIETEHRGGISSYKPVTGNRNTCVMLFHK